MSLSHSNSVLQEEAAKLIDHSRPIANQARAHAMQRLQVELIVRLDRHTARRRALHSFCNRVGITEVILVALSKRLGISWRYLFDLVTKRNQLPSHVVRGHAGFDPDQAWLNVHKSCSNPVPRDLFAQNNGASLIQANHVQCVLAGIDPDRANNGDSSLARHGVLLVLIKSPKTDPAGRPGREHGRSIPFATLRAAELLWCTT